MESQMNLRCEDKNNSNLINTLCRVRSPCLTVIQSKNCLRRCGGNQYAIILLKSYPKSL